MGDVAGSETTTTLSGTVDALKGNVAVEENVAIERVVSMEESVAMKEAIAMGECVAMEEAPSRNTEKITDGEEKPENETATQNGISHDVTITSSSNEENSSNVISIASDVHDDDAAKSGCSFDHLKVLQKKLNAFKEWCKNNALKLSEKISLEFTGTSHRYGLMATSDMKRGETLFTIPRKLLINPDCGTLASELEDYEIWLQTIGRSMEDSSGWVPLLITLMHEFTKEDSFWAPYLDLMPSTSEFGHPLFWNTEELFEELSGMVLLQDLLEDRKNIEEEYKDFVLPFLVQNKHLSKSLEKFNIDLFKRMVAFVMAYSFTEDQDGSPVMIPMADMLNHHSNNNANLIFERDCLRMISCRKIDKGEEIFNTFGRLGNAELLQMYGYTERENCYNAFPIYAQTFIDVVEQSAHVSPSYLQAMLALMYHTGVVLSSDYFVFDKNGMRRGPDLLHFLRLIHMSEQEFDDVLKSRACSRPDSFCQKLLRKLKLAKKTDTSSGVAVIDITDDDNDRTSPEKRKYFQLEEDSARYSNEDVVTNGASIPLNHCGAEVVIGETNSTKKQKLSHYPENGNTSGEPIVIDDDDDEDDGEPINKTAKIDDSDCDDTKGKSKNEITRKGHNNKKDEIQNDNEKDSNSEKNRVAKNDCNDKEEEMESESKKTESESFGNKKKTDSEIITSTVNENESVPPSRNSHDSAKNNNDVKDTTETNDLDDKNESESNPCHSVQSLRDNHETEHSILENINNKTANENDNCTKNSDILSEKVNKDKDTVDEAASSIDENCSAETTSKHSPSCNNVVNTENNTTNENQKPNGTCSSTNVTSQESSEKSKSSADEVLTNATCEDDVAVSKEVKTVVDGLNTVECFEVSCEDAALPEIDSSAATITEIDSSAAAIITTTKTEGLNNVENILDNNKRNHIDEMSIHGESKIDADDNHDVTANNVVVDDDDDDDDDDIEIVSEDVGCVLSYEKLKEALQPAWKETMRKVLTKTLSAMKADDENGVITVDENLTREQYNAQRVRRGQRTIMKLFLEKSLS